MRRLAETIADGTSLPKRAISDDGTESPAMDVILLFRLALLGPTLLVTAIVELFWAPIAAVAKRPRI